MYKIENKAYRFVLEEASIADKYQTIKKIK